MVLALLAPRPPSTAPPDNIARTPIPSWISVYFSSPGRQPPQGERIEDGFREFVDGARQSIDVAVYLIDDPRVVDAILRAHARGTRVRMVLDSDMLDQARREGQREAVQRLMQAEVPLVGDARPGLMHHKFAVRDGAEVWTGSWNFTEGDSRRMNNAGLWIRSPELAANFQNEFEQMFTERRFGPAKRAGVPYPRVVLDGAVIETYFSPRDRGLERLIERVDQAGVSVLFLAFSFTHEELGQAVQRRRAAGVRVQGVMERSGSETVFSQFGPLRSAGLDLLTDANPSLMHHKTFLLDGRTVVTGSMNHSRSVTRSNDENVLFIDDASLAQRFEAEYQAIFDEARSGRLSSSAEVARSDMQVEIRPSD